MKRHAQEDPDQRVDRRIARTRRLIRDAFYQLLEESDFESVTVTAIAKAADIDRKTFYAHYSSIEELAEREAGIVVARLIGSIPLGETDGGVPDLRGIFAELVEITNENPAVFRRAFKSIPLNQMVDMLAAPLCDAVADARGFAEAGELRSCSYLVRFYVSGTLSMFARYLDEDDTPTAEELLEIVDGAAALLEQQLDAKDRQTSEMRAASCM